MQSLCAFYTRVFDRDPEGRFGLCAKHVSYLRFKGANRSRLPGACARARASERTLGPPRGFTIYGVFMLAPARPLIRGRTTVVNHPCCRCNQRPRGELRHGHFPPGPDLNLNREENIARSIERDLYSFRGCSPAYWHSACYNATLSATNRRILFYTRYSFNSRQLRRRYLFLGKN